MSDARQSYLLDGRRVRVRDLLDAGLLAARDPLYFTRRRTGDTVEAVVNNRGSIVVGSTGYRTPSAAARRVTGTQIDGWTAWVDRNGTSLHTLRLRLLDDAAKVAAAGDGKAAETGDAELLARHEFLRRARTAAEAGAPESIRVRALIGRWGAQARGDRITRQIEAELDNHGLRTHPHFHQVALDDEVVIAAVEPDGAGEDGEVEQDGLVDVDDLSAPAESVADIVSDVGVDDVEPRDMGLTLGNLVRPDHPVVWVKPSATFEEAMTKMLLNDFSQLPVMSSKHNLRGAVTWQSIAEARMADPSAPFEAAIVSAARHSFDDDLHDVLTTLQEEDFVVVHDAHNEIYGIVTTADVVELYGELSQPFLLVGELDRRLRLVMETFELNRLNEVFAASGRPALSSYDDMTMGHYQRVLEDPECWSKLGWPLDQRTFVGRLDELRRLRNDITHFNPDGVPEGSVERLRHMLRLVRRFGQER